MWTKERIIQGNQGNLLGEIVHGIQDRGTVRVVDVMGKVRRLQGSPWHTTVAYMSLLIEFQVAMNVFMLGRNEKARHFIQISNLMLNCGCFRTQALTAKKEFGKSSLHCLSAVAASQIAGRATCKRLDEY